VVKDTLTSDDERAEAAEDSPSQRTVETSDRTTDATLATLPDLALVRVDQETWDFFVKVLDQPPEKSRVCEIDAGAGAVESVIRVASIRYQPQAAG
jgi:hypothetical protein